MFVLLLALIVVLFGLGFLDPLWWVAAAVLVFVVTRHGRDRGGGWIRGDGSDDGECRDHGIPRDRRDRRYSRRNRARRQREDRRDGDRERLGRAMNLWGPRAAEASGATEPTGPDTIAVRAETDRSRQVRATRAVVDEACAIVMVLAPCPRGPARNLLGDIARQCDSRVPDVAAALVATWEGEPLPRRIQRGLRHALRRFYAEDRGDGSPPVDEPSGRRTP